jgi:hypothetical protein
MEAVSVTTRIIVGNEIGPEGGAERVSNRVDFLTECDGFDPEVYQHLCGSCGRVSESDYSDVSNLMCAVRAPGRRLIESFGSRVRTASVLLIIPALLGRKDRLYSNLCSLDCLAWRPVLLHGKEAKVVINQH